MGYDLHITRAEDWSMNDGKWITPEEWLSAVREDTDLEIISESEPYVAVWLKDPSRTEFFFDWRKGNISTKNPTKSAIIKMEELARRLNAKVQGDDGETYENGIALPEERLPQQGNLFWQRLKNFCAEYKARWEITKSMRDIKCPFKVGDRVKTIFRNGGVVIEVDPRGNYGMGRIKVRFPDGVEIVYAFVANDLEKEDTESI